jgi:hypothetical protein
VRDTIYIRDELVLEAHPEGPYIVLRREGEPSAVRIYLNELRHLADAMCSMATEVAGLVVGEEEPSGDSSSGRSR